MLVKEHLKELKVEAYKLALPLVILFIIFFTLAKPIVNFLLTYYNIPINSIVSLNPFESLQTSLMIAGSLTLLFSFPMILNSIFNYCKEMIPTKILKKSKKIISISYILALMGVSFGIFIFGKLVLNNIITSYTLTTASWGIMSVFSFIITSSITLGLAMQIILIVPALEKIGLITKKGLKRSKPFVFIGILILSALATPPDITSMLIMSIPIYGAYELGIILTKFHKEEIQC